MTQNVDIFICGSGSAGLCAATWLARYGLSCKIVESRSGPLVMGQADGVQCRTVEVFESFGVAEELLRESYHVSEVTFWQEQEDGNHIRRTRRAPDTAKGLSHMPHVILNQARINGLLLEVMERSGGQRVDYGVAVKGVEVDEERVDDPEAYCVTVRTEREGKKEVFKAKYVLGCDGAHSAVRKSLGIQMVGDSSDAVWGVMDIYPQTNFPDIRRKVVMQSKAGSVLIIPREGGSLCRLYIELPRGTSPKSVKLEELQNTARRVFHPYTIDIAETYWWSAYSIGQRLAERFSHHDRVLLTGDACHTHSPKAGQGMNVSLQDGYNIGWKLASILKGHAHPDLIKTYTLEREKVASDLINFDRDWAKSMSSKESDINGNFSEKFVQAGRYTAGLATIYLDSSITNSNGSSQGLASKLKVGMRFPSTQVVRHCDAKAMQLVKALPADGRWRLVIFGGDIDDDAASRRLSKLAEYLSAEDGPVRRFTPDKDDIDSFIETILVLSGQHADIEQDRIPDYFWPVTGRWKMRDMHKVYVDEESYNSGHGHAYEFYGIGPQRGAVAIVRPDQYVSAVYDLDNHKLIGKFFDGFALPRA